MTQSIRDAAQSLLDAMDAVYKRGRHHADLLAEGRALKALKEALAAPQPTADELVAEHMRLVDEHAAAYYSTFLGTFVGPEEASPRKVTHAAVEQSARALLSASQEDAKHAAMYRFTRKMSADHGIDYMRRCDTEDQIDAAIRAAMSAKETGDAA